MQTGATTDGVLLIDKVPGLTSHDVVDIARRSLGTRRVGHTGTLDPFATGLLVLLVGKATRLAPYVEGEPKVYEASIAFGAQTATDDCTGAIVRVAPVPSAVDVDHAIIRLTGTIDQRPPDYSAKKIQGVRAYAAARSGAPLVLDPVIVTVHSWRIRNRSPDAIHVTISCSAGTYVRALARDLGLMAGSAAHLTGLRRVQSGGFHVRDAIDLETIRAARPALRSALAAVPQLPTQTLTPHELRDVEHGRAVEARVGGELVALVDDRTALAAIARREAGMLKPKLVLRDA